jgi:alpha-1,3-rhamnosyl/mannosyltransferase
MTLSVAIYASPLRSIGKPTGVGQHIARMAEHLADRPDITASLLATRADYEQVRPYLSARLAALPIHFLPGAERLLRTALIATNFFGIERWSGEVDWVYCPKEQPVATRRARLAVTVHDVLPFERNVPGLERKFHPVLSLRWRLLMRRILQRADLIAIVSEFTRRRMLELFDVRDEKRLVVIGNGVGSCYFSSRQREDSEILARHGLTADRYLITVGSLTFRKGGDVLLKLALRLREQHLPWRVVVTGQRHDAELLERSRAMKAEYPDLPLDLTGYVPDGEQAVLLRNALALVFPSRYEGFGIPVLEAMAAGTPVVCRPAAALPEVAGDAAAFVDSDEPEAWLLPVLSLAENSASRPKLVEAGRRRAAEFTWDRCAARLVAAMSEKS